jgi:hypothetical protein
MSTTKPTLTELEQLETLRRLLLRDERSMIAKHEMILSQDEALEQKIGPVIEAHLDVMRTQFPEEYKQVVDNLIKHRLASSKDEIIGMLYPEIGGMIKSYVQLQMTLLRESVAAQLQASKKSIFFWRKPSPAVQLADQMIAQASRVHIEEIFLIEYPAGTIIGHAARHISTSPDAVAGMLTAIKAFVSDAFAKQEQNLQLIQYDTHILMLEHYHSFYFAALLSGPVTRSEQDALSEKMRQFLQHEYLSLKEAKTDVARKLISLGLATTFVQ